MKKLRNILYVAVWLLVGIGTPTGCIEEYEADISADDTDLLVVEGTICAAKVNRFVLTRSQAFNSGEGSYTPQRVTGAKVAVRGSDGSEYATQESYGLYTCKIESLNPNVSYYLHIETDGEVYESDPQRPLQTGQITEISGVQDTPEDNINVYLTVEASGQTSYYLWTYDETWELHPSYTTNLYYDAEKLEVVVRENQFPERGWVDATSTSIMIGATTNYEGQHIQNLKLYDIDRGDSRIFHRYSGLVHQRAISKAEYEYEMARRQAGSEMGGLFTPLPSALPTNVHCLTSEKHVIGFVGCSLNTSDYRFFLNGDDFSTRRATQTDGRIWLDAPTPEDCLQMVSRGLYLCEMVPPDMSLDGLMHMAWATINQLDVRYRYEGVYIVEPEFWSLKGNVSY